MCTHYFEENKVPLFRGDSSSVASCSNHCPRVRNTNSLPSLGGCLQLCYAVSALGPPLGAQLKREFPKDVVLGRDAKTLASIWRAQVMSPISLSFLGFTAVSDKITNSNAGSEQKLTMVAVVDQHEEGLKGRLCMRSEQRS